MAEKSAFEQVEEALNEAMIWLHTMSDKDFAKLIAVSRRNLINAEARARGLQLVMVDGVRVHAPPQEPSNG